MSKRGRAGVVGSIMRVSGLVIATVGLVAVGIVAEAGQSATGSYSTHRRPAGEPLTRTPAPSVTGPRCWGAPTDRSWRAGVS